MGSSSGGYGCWACYRSICDLHRSWQCWSHCCSGRHIFPLPGWEPWKETKNSKAVEPRIAFVPAMKSHQSPLFWYYESESPWGITCTSFTPTSFTPTVSHSQDLNTMPLSFVPGESWHVCTRHFTGACCHVQMNFSHKWRLWRCFSILFWGI